MIANKKICELFNGYLTADPVLHARLYQKLLMLVPELLTLQKDDVLTKKTTSDGCIIDFTLNVRCDLRFIHQYKDDKHMVVNLGHFHRDQFDGLTADPMIDACIFYKTGKIATLNYGKCFYSKKKIKPKRTKEHENNAFDRWLTDALEKKYHLMKSS